MSAWLRFCFGKPKRTLTFLVLLGIGYIMLNPGVLVTMVARLLAEVQPLIGPLLFLAIFVYAIRRLIGR